MGQKQKMIEKLIKEKLIFLENNKASESEKNRFYLLYNIISDKNQTFFEKLKIETAKEILIQLGIKEEEWFDVYVELREEESEGRYVLIDLNEDDLRGKDER